MPSGGRRPGAGRPRKAAAKKILDGNPGKRPIEVLNFDTGGMELPSEPPEYLTPKAKEIYRTVFGWLKSIGCTNGILPYNLEEYAFCKARWLECEEMNTKHGLLVKDQNGKAVPSPFVTMAQQYLKQTKYSSNRKRIKCKKNSVAERWGVAKQSDTLYIKERKILRGHDPAENIYA